MRTKFIIFIIMIACCTVSAGSNNETDRLKVLEVLQHKQLTIESQLQTLAL